MADWSSVLYISSRSLPIAPWYSCLYAFKYYNLADSKLAGCLMMFVVSGILIALDTVLRLSIGVFRSLTMNARELLEGVSHMRTQASWLVTVACAGE